MPTHHFPCTVKTRKACLIAGLEVATWSLEAQPFQSQIILKPGTPPLTKNLFQISMKNTHKIWVKRGSHSVFGNPAPQVPENPKAEHPTPKSRASFLRGFNSVLAHLTMTKATSKDLKVKRAKRHTLCVRGRKQSTTYVQVSQGKRKTRRSNWSTLQKASPMDQCFLNLLSFSWRFQNSNFFEQICLKLNPTSKIAFELCSSLPRNASSS